MFVEYDIITKVFNSTGQTGCINVKKTVTTQPRNLSHVLVDVFFLIGEWRNGRRYPIIREAELKTALWVRILSYLHISRDGGSWSARQAHNLEIVGSNPTPATNLKKLLS